MLNILHNLIQLAHVDPRVPELEEKLFFYKMMLLGFGIALIIFITIVYLQRRGLKFYKNAGASLKIKPGSPVKKILGNKSDIAVKTNAKITPKKLPDPGLLFQFSLAKEHVKDKLITIGQAEGNIKTYSTEIIDDHLSISIRILENLRDKDIYDLPDRIYEEYQLDIRRGGKALIYFSGLNNFTEMGSRQRIYIKGKPDEAGEPTFPTIDVRKPIRFRLGDRLNSENKFVNGYFEFHLFTKDYMVKTKAGIDKVEKNFIIRLYKIYPGYDISSPSDEGFYPMIDPYTTGE